MEEPLKYLYERYGFDRGEIKEVVVGKKYLAVLLDNGNMGVCAILKNEIEKDSFIFYNNLSQLSRDVNDSYSEEDKRYLHESVELDLNIVGHRILYTAWLNAKINYENDYSEQKDIFDLIDFSKYKKIVMIGYFKPVAEKLRNAEMAFSVFDLYSKDKEIVPLEKQREYVMGADAVILTATSIFNDTFRSIVCNSSPGACDIFVLGPSAILSKEILKYRNVKYIFGFVFPKEGEKALKIIREGGGTKSFNKFGSKVYI